MSPRCAIPRCGRTVTPRNSRDCQGERVRLAVGATDSTPLGKTSTPCRTPSPASRGTAQHRGRRLGGVERPGQVKMVEAVQRAIDERGAPGRPGRHGHRQVAGLPGARDPARDRHRRAPWWSPPPRSRCSASSSTATCPAWPRRSPSCCRTSRRSRSSRAAATTCAATRRRAGWPEDDEQDQLFDPREVERDRADGPAHPGVGRRDRDRRPRRAGARRQRAGLAAGLGERPGSAWAPRAARAAPSASPSWPGRAPARPTSSSPTTRCWPSTRWRTSPSCPSTTWSSSTRRTSWSTG